MTEVAEVLHLAKNRKTGRWEHGYARRSDDHVDIIHSTPRRGCFSTDPEQLFAAGWAASFDGTMALAAIKVKVVLSDNSTIDAAIDLYLVDGAYFVQARLNACLMDMPPEVALMLADMAHLSGPHSKAIRGDIDVEINLV